MLCLSYSWILCPTCFRPHPANSEDELNDLIVFFKQVTALLNYSEKSEPTNSWNNKIYITHLQPSHVSAVQLLFPKEISP